jgi:hypothetical protein
VNAKSGLEGHLQLQAASPAQNDRAAEGEQLGPAPGKQRTPINGPGGEQAGGEQFDNPGGEQFRGEQFENPQGEQLGGEQTEEEVTTSQSDRPSPDEQDSQWLKSVLPSASNGWWDVRVKGDRFTVRFRWRGPDIQVIPLLHISREDIHTLKQDGLQDVQKRIRDQIAVSLQSFLLAPTKRDKAAIAAEKLGIEIENYQAGQIEKD